MSMELAAPVGTAKRERKVVGLICAAHFLAHFHLMLLPPLFPLLHDFYGVDFVQLGFAVSLFSVMSGLTQVPFGFLVDRIGARTILITATFVEGMAMALIGVIPLYGALLVLMATAGLANAIYHPADYAILNASVGRLRIGRAFSFHTFCGNMGDALAPMTVLILASFLGWRSAIFACGSFGVIVAILLWMNSSILTGASSTPQATNPGNEKDGATHRTGMALLFSTPIVMGLLFYVGISMTGGMKTFAVSALHQLYQAPLGTATMVLSAYLFGAPLGVLTGGFAVNRIPRHDLVAAGCFVCVGACFLAVAAFDPPLLVIGLLFAIAGFCTGFVAPQRDMMIRSVTPPGQMGKVFAFVSTGFNVGGIIAPIVYGWLLDHSSARNVFWACGVLALLTVATVLVTGVEQRRARAQA